MSHFHRSLFATLALVAGCTSAVTDADEDIEDGIDEGKTDAPSIAEGSTEACVVLHVANTATLQELDVDARLSRRAATNIVNRRTYATIAALDAVPYVGPATLAALLAYAEGNGDLDACEIVVTPPPATCTHPDPTGAFTSELIAQTAGDYLSNALLQPFPGEPSPRVVYGKRYASTFGEIRAHRPTLNSTLYYVTDNANLMHLQNYDDMAVTGGADQCVAFIDRDVQLNVKCQSFGVRVVSPNIRSDFSNNAALAMGRHGSQLQFVYAYKAPMQTASILTWMPYTVNASTGETHPGPTETITTDPVGRTALVIDSTGRPHVVYRYRDSAGAHVGYATRAPAGWTTTKLADTMASSDMPQGLSIALVADRPTIAYYNNTTRSLDYAVQQANGSFAISTLVAPSSQFATDTAGTSVALSVDPCGEVWAVYERAFTTDPQPDQLVVGKIGNGSISYLPLPNSGRLTRSYREPSDLSFYIDENGRQFVAAIGRANDRIYYASR